MGVSILVSGIAKQVKHFNIRHQTPFGSQYHFETDIACEFIGSGISREGDGVVSNWFCGSLAVFHGFTLYGEQRIDREAGLEKLHLERQDAIKESLRLVLRTIGIVMRMMAIGTTGRRP